MRIALLGSVELLDDGATVHVASRRQRQLLVVLGLRNGQTTSTDTITEWVWGSDLPTDPVATVQTNVSRLRRLLRDPIELSTHDGSYRLTVPADSIDVQRFESLIVDNRGAPPGRLADLMSEALSLWRGTPFTEVDHPDIDAMRAHFETLHLEAIESRLDALHLLGRHDEVVALAEPHVMTHPARERPVATLMKSLYATGRQSDALDRFRRLSDVLVDELGVDPSLELRDLEVAILQQNLNIRGPATAVTATEDRPADATTPDEPIRLTQRIRFCHTSDDVRLAYATSGEGPPLVRAANWMTHLDYDWDSPVWRHWLHGLSERHQLIRYDERGCGLSDWNIERFSFDAWVDDLEAIVEELDLRDFPLLGISQGGAVAIAYAQRHPDRVSRLILCGAYGQGRAVRAVNDEQRREAAMHLELARVGWGKDDPAFRQVFTSQFMPGGTLEEWESFNELQRRTTSAENAVRFMDVFANIDVMEAATDVRCPVLIVHSRDELRVPTSSARELAAALSDSHMLMLPSRNHILLHDEPAWPMFLDEVHRFIDAT